MGKKTIFVSCGQLTEAERTLGVLVKAIIDGTPGFEAYFAETVQDLESLGHHLMTGIQQCAGAVVVLQDRGIVINSEGTEWGHRSSVWVNQEVAILAYRQFHETNKIPILAFADTSVKLEGAMTSLIVNPRPLTSSSEVADSVRAWLTVADFASGTRDTFTAKWEQLTDNARRVVAGLLAEGGRNVNEQVIRRAVVREFQMSSEAASEALQQSKLEFQNTDLVKRITNTPSGPEMSVHPTWESQLRRQCNQWLAETKPK